jgi:high-affinity nickel-transport protein
VFYNITITSISVAVALIIGTIELVGVLAHQANITSGPLAAIAGINLNYAGYVIVGVFFGSWVIAMGVWRYGRIEEKWSADLVPADASLDSVIVDMGPRTACPRQDSNLRPTA